MRAYLTTVFACLILFAIGSEVHAQADSTKTKRSFASRIFQPSLDVGYLHPNSGLLGGAMTTRTSLEYRIRNNNDLFVRLGYDTYGSRYKLPVSTSTTNTIEGTVNVQDVFLAPGYRFGDRTFRITISLMPGMKFYEFPVATVEGQSIALSNKSRRIFTSSVMSSLEFYFDEKSALTLSLFQNQVWEKTDFWTDGGGAYGISLGFITSLVSDD